MANIVSRKKPTPGKGSFKPGSVWVRKNRKSVDREEFVLLLREAEGLRFKGYTGLFSLEHFEPKG
jgi:hypothetical protein